MDLLTDEEKTDAAIGATFTALVQNAKANGLAIAENVSTPDGQLFSPDPDASQQFIAGCRAVLKSLTPGAAQQS